MSTLENPRYEAFAQAGVKGALLIDADESAGFMRHGRHPSGLALMDEVADPIAELRAMQTDMDDVGPIGLLASLRRIIKAEESSENPNLVNAARLAILDASRLQVELARRCSHERRYLDKVFNRLAAKQGADEASRVAAQRPSPPRQAPAAAPSAPRQRPTSAPRAPHNLLASAAMSPMTLPGLSTVPSRGMAAGKILGRLDGEFDFQ